MGGRRSRYWCGPGFSRETKLVRGTINWKKDHAILDKGRCLEHWRWGRRGDTRLARWPRKRAILTCIRTLDRGLLDGARGLYHPPFCASAPSSSVATGASWIVASSSRRVSFPACLMSASALPICSDAASASLIEFPSVNIRVLICSSTTPLHDYRRAAESDGPDR